MTKTNTKAKSNVTSISDRALPKIEKDIPVPTRANHWGYLASMKKTDSVFINEKTYDVDRAVNSIRSFGYNHGISFTARKVEGGARVWRV